MTIIREKFIAAPQITAAPGGVLTHATVIENDAIGWRDERGVFPSWNCLDTLVPTTICPGNVPVEKGFDQAEWVPGFNFSVYGGVNCRLVGYDRAEAYENLRRVFLVNESKGVERALMETRFQPSPSGQPNSWNGATDITPVGGPVSPSVGLAMLEDYAGYAYAGVPTIHAPRIVASLLAQDSLEREGDRFHTKLGSKFVNGAGYSPSLGPGGVSPGTGEFWLYATGEIVVERGEIFQRDTQDLPYNEDYALVERTYRVVVDCFVAAVRVEVY